jgi:8-oxo-dGTP pyrophosphatase MutT (NUDIX family)
MTKIERTFGKIGRSVPFQAQVGVYAIVEEREGKIALLLRSNTGFSDGLFGLPSGHVDGGETLIEAVSRELTEELGIKPLKNALNLQHVLHRLKPNGTERLDFFFRCTAWEGKARNREPHKHGGLVWKLPHQLPENMVAYHRQGLLESSVGRPLSFWGWDDVRGSTTSKRSQDNHPALHLAK